MQEDHITVLIYELCPVAFMFGKWPSVTHSAVLSLGSGDPGMARSSNCKEIDALKSVSGDLDNRMNRLRAVSLLL